MTPLLVILGFLATGVLFTRIVYVFDLHVKTNVADEWERDDPVLLTILTLLWPLVLVLSTVVGVFYGAYRLITMPTRRQRKEERRKEARRLELDREIQREREAREAEDLARKLGLPTIETRGDRKE